MTLLNRSSGLTRISSNYFRLLLNLCFGIILIPILLKTVGNAGTGVIGFLGASVGLANIVSEVARESMIREIGVAYHKKKSKSFRKIYNSATALSALGAVLTAAIFLLLIWALPLLSIPDNLIVAAQVFLLAKTFQVAIEVALTAQINMLLIKELMVAYNIYQVLNRAVLLLAGLLLLALPPGMSVSHKVITYGFTVSSAQSLMAIIIGAIVIWSHPDLRLKFSHVNKQAMRTILTVAGWGVGTSTAPRLQERVGSLLMNIYYGTAFGSLIWDQIGFRLSSYIRMISSGVTSGIDAVSIRVSDSAENFSNLLKTTTRIHAMVTLPAGIGLFLLTDPLLKFWLGSSIENPEITLPAASLIIKILAIGLSIRGISDGWVRVLYGAGHITKYAPIVFISGIATPVLALILIYALKESRFPFTSVALAYSATYIIFQLLLMPVIVAKKLHCAISDFYQPILRPLVVAILSGLIMEAWILFIGTESYSTLAGALAIFLVCTAVMSWHLTLTLDERTRLRSILSKVK